MYKNSSFVIAAVISIAVHATAAVYLEHYAAPPASQPQSAARVLQISLAPATPAAPQPEPPPIPETRPAAEPPPPPEPAPKPEVKREPLPEPVIEPRPASSEVPEPAEPVEEQVVATAYPEAPIDKPALTRVVLENERESYLLQLLAHIDSHKFYPRSARRRGMEGEIQVAFYLLRDGSISGLQIKGGSKLLRKAAKQAVQQSLALPPPPESMRLQEQIRFGMVYRLDG
ncbi:MAG: energy transducer TonB [Gammaproteobacteria bacterium]|nr:energy transducer TonB [Gammaproteobacteria bacterium]